MKIYTKGGDRGRTSLVGGARVGKDDLRVEAYGTVDELSAHLGHLYDTLTADAPGRDDLPAAMECLMAAGALLAADAERRPTLPQLPVSATAALEARIDEFSAALPPVKGFTLPCGHPAVSQCHICRTVCRRAERAVIRAAREHGEIPEVAIYLNRLSDYLYTLGRTLSAHYGAAEHYWLSRGTE